MFNLKLFSTMLMRILFIFIALSFTACIDNESTVFPDCDADGIPDNLDNAVCVYNPSQSDLDGDGIGDVIDNDIDGDGIENSADSNPTNRFVCMDSDLDGCDDCHSGTFDPSNDGSACDPDPPQPEFGTITLWEAAGFQWRSITITLSDYGYNVCISFHDESLAFADIISSLRYDLSPGVVFFLYAGGGCNLYPLRLEGSGEISNLSVIGLNDVFSTCRFDHN